MMTQAEPVLAEIAQAADSVYRYARRWVVAQSPSPADAVIYDAVIKVLNQHAQPHWTPVVGATSAVQDRHIRNGPEAQDVSFSIPTTVTDAVVVLHRFARRYTNGRGTHTAAVVNQVARDLLASGVDLTSTRRIDGTYWAADGAEGAYDGLDAEQRREALAALNRTN